MAITVLKFTVKGLLESLEITVGRTDGRLERYRRRIAADGDRDGKVKYTSSLRGDWELWPEKECVSEKDSGATMQYPVFFETRYFVRCDFDKSVTDARVVHPMASISDAFSFSHNTLVGSLDFVNSPGKFRFIVEFKRGVAWESVVLEWFVASEKMDVETDLAVITKRIKKASPSLVHAFLAKTMLGAGVGMGEEKQDDNLWMSLFSRIFNEYQEAVKVVVNRPHLKYVPHAEYVRAERIKRWSPTLETRYQNMDPAFRPVALFRSERVDPEIDTIENRFVLFTLNELARRAGSFADVCEEHESVSTGFVKRLREHRADLLQLSSSPFFRGVGRFTGFKQESLALQRKPGYARIYSDWLVMQQTLDPAGVQIDIGYRPVSALYEFWCFLTIRDKIAASSQFKCEHPVPKIGSMDELGDLFADPDSDDDSLKMNKLVYEFPEQRVPGMDYGSRLLTLTYQQSYNTGDVGAFVYLNPQRPDIVLTIKDTTKPDGEGEYSYIFDAKYRIRPTKDDNAKDATTTEAIDAMHRYRDAILYRRQKSDKQLSREIIGAYVLYPGRPEPNSVPYESVIAAENLGAIPLLPAEHNPDGSYKLDENGHHGEEKLDTFLSRILKLSTAEQHLGVDAQGHARVIPTRGTTAVVGEAVRLADLQTIELPANQWPVVTEDREQSLIRLTAEQAAKLGPLPAYVRIQSANKAAVLVKLVEYVSGTDRESNYRIEWSSAEEL